MYGTSDNARKVDVKMLTRIIISGFGGQGVLFIGKCLAYSAMLIGKELSWLPSYGPEMRGGTANCSVCISDDAIGSPLVTSPDILIAMNEPSFDKFEKKLCTGGKLFSDNSMIEKKSRRTDIKCFELPASDIAQNNSLPCMANIILLGKTIKECSDMLFGINISTVTQVFEKIIPAKKNDLIQKNISALNLGYSM